MVGGREMEDGIIYTSIISHKEQHTDLLVFNINWARLIFKYYNILVL